MKKYLLIVACSLAIDARAGSDIIEFDVSETPLFQYEQATVATPVKVPGKSRDGKCEGTISLVGLQGGVNSTGGTLAGRIENGQCGGVPIAKSIVTGMSAKEGTSMRLKSPVFVVLPN